MNRWPADYESAALPTELYQHIDFLGRLGLLTLRTTGDLLITNQLLYRLSYSSTKYFIFCCSILCPAHAPNGSTYGRVRLQQRVLLYPVFSGSSSSTFSPAGSGLSLSDFCAVLPLPRHSAQQHGLPSLLPRTNFPASLTVRALRFRQKIEKQGRISISFFLPLM